jgi:hypothetical protein
MTTAAVWLAAGQAPLPGYSHTAAIIGTILVLIVIGAEATIAACACRHIGAGADRPARPRHCRTKGRHF